MALHLLTDAEIAILRDVIAERKNRRVNTPSRPSGERSYSEGEDHQAPEVYIAYPPSGGIPALVRGEGTGTGTGTGTGNVEDEPGVAECTIYDIINRNGIPELVASPAHSRDVYNISTAAISQDWIQIHRSKQGKWLAITGGGGSGAIIVRFTIVELLELHHACAELNAWHSGVATIPEVNEGSCIGAGVGTAGDQIEVVDATGCLSLDVGQQGYAVYMEREAEGSGTLRQWEIIFLCCE